MISTRFSSELDPLTLALRPPPDETVPERELRISAEAEAARISREIDKQIDREREERKRRRPEIKVLLLGPSGAGKSTTLKNFQLSFTPKALQAEAATYTSLIFLNVISSVRLLHDLFADPDAAAAASLPADLRPRAERLQAVVALESALARRFGDAAAAQRLPGADGGGPNAYELSLRTGGIWQLLRSARDGRPASPTSGERDAERERVRAVLAERREDIEAVVSHPDVQALLVARDIRLEYLPGYFLDDLPRITAPDYSPSDEDILRTRVRTLCVTEMNFSLESGRDKGQSWVVVDVGGARHQRAAWVPYFDDANAVIFMAPIGHFDQFLEEDQNMNALRDTLELWSAIVSQKLLSNTQFILFLNKHDMLQQKLNAGVKFSKYVPSYSGENDAEHVCKYLKAKFATIHRHRSPKSRTLHVHFTSVTDKSSTAALIANFRALILETALKETNMI